MLDKLLVLAKKLLCHGNGFLRQTRHEVILVLFFADNVILEHLKFLKPAACGYRILVFTVRELDDIRNISLLDDAVLLLLVSDNIYLLVSVHE